MEVNIYFNGSGSLLILFAAFVARRAYTQLERNSFGRRRTTRTMSRGRYGVDLLVMWYLAVMLLVAWRKATWKSL